MTWTGKYRADLVEQTLHPRMRPGGIPTCRRRRQPLLRHWAARYWRPLMMALISGRLQRFSPNVGLAHSLPKNIGGVCQREPRRLARHRDA